MWLRFGNIEKERTSLLCSCKTIWNNFWCPLYKLKPKTAGKQDVGGKLTWDEYSDLVALSFLSLAFVFNIFVILDTEMN